MLKDRIPLYGRIILDGQIRAMTGLHIGGSPGALAIGGVDLPVIRNGVNQEPYIPGSSLKGKMRSLWEKVTGVEQNFFINRAQGKEVRIHACQNAEQYNVCPVCQIYGATGDSGAAFPTRIIVRDAPLDKISLENAKTDLPFSEVKWEATIDRITSAATPRQIERVPAGAIFKEMQIVFNIYDAKDHERFWNVLTALQLVEDDYLGGHGSRGSGRVKFETLQLICKTASAYSKANPPTRALGGLEALTDKAELIAWLQASVPVPATGGR